MINAPTAKGLLDMTKALFLFFLDVMVILRLP